MNKLNRLTQFVSLSKFCTLTGMDIDKVRQNIKNKQTPHKFIASNYKGVMINYRAWLEANPSKNQELKAA